MLNKVKKNVLLHKLFWISISTGCILFLVWIAKKFINANRTAKCEPTIITDLSSNESRSLQGDMDRKQVICYEVFVKAEQQLIINSNVQIKLRLPDNETFNLQGERDFEQPGEYILTIENSKKYQISLDIKETGKTLAKNSDRDLIADKIERRSTNSKDQSKDKIQSTQLIYNRTNPPAYQQDKKLQNIVDDIVYTAKQRSLRTDKLSISLIDLNSSDNVYARASFADNQPRYPASVVKLFWLVALFGQYEKGMLPPGKISEQTLSDLIKDSDNEAGSLVLDTITKSESGSSLSLENIKAWKAKRETVNLFFEKAGYSDININQKTYPIPYLKMNLPVGRDKQLRDKALELRKQEINPIRNSLTTNSVARLFLEIYSDRAISEFYSAKAKELLKRDLNPAAWKEKPYNSIKGFFGEGLPPDTNFYSKMGWTFNNRNDAAIIISYDRKISYILVIFGDDKSFYEDKSFLPQVSKEVYRKMTDLHNSESP